MDLPALLPKNIDAYLLELAKNPHDLTLFFEAAAENETWAFQHREFMSQALIWLTDQFFQDKISLEIAGRVAHTIHRHRRVLEIPQNITIAYDGIEIPANSLLWGASSDFMRTLIRQELRDKNQKRLFLENVNKELFSLVEDFINTGEVTYLWKLTESEIIQLLKQASQWELTRLVEMSEEVLRKFITKDNVIDKMIIAHAQGWEALKWSCMRFVNESSLGVHFEKTAARHFSFQFTSFKDEALEIFEQLRPFITHFICSHDLTEDPHFSETLQKLPALICLDISQSSTFSDRLADMPRDLQQLILAKCGWITNKNLKNVLSFCPHLTYLSLASNNQINYLGWGALSSLKELQGLDISRCRQIGDSEFKIILQACRNLTDIELEECTDLTDEAFLMLGKMAPKLTDCNFSRCNITDRALIDLTTRCPQLTRLNLTRCLRLTEPGIMEAIRNASQLKEIDLSKCRLREGFGEEIHQLRPLLKLPNQHLS